MGRSPRLFRFLQRARRGLVFDHGNFAVALEIRRRLFSGSAS